MTSYNLVNGEYTPNRYDLLQSVCRDEWGFKGMIMTDWYTSQHQPMRMGKFKPIYPISSSAGCIKAGNDLQMLGCEKNEDGSSVSVIGGADGPTSVFVAGKIGGNENVTYTQNTMEEAKQIFESGEETGYTDIIEFGGVMDWTGEIER